MTISKEAISRAIFDPGATEGYKGERTLTEWQTDAVMRALSTLPIAVEGTVKALEWVDMGEGPRGITVCGMYAISPSSGPYGKEKLTLTGMPGTLFGKFDTISEAKAAAQTDFERRILSALSSSPGKDGGQEEAVSGWRWSFDDGDTWSYGPSKPENFAFGGPDVVEPLYTRPQPASTALVEKGGPDD